MGKLKKILKKSKEIVDKAKKKKTKKHGKVSQEQKDLAVTTGVVASGTLAAAKAQSNRNKTGETGLAPGNSNSRRARQENN